LFWRMTYGKILGMKQNRGLQLTLVTLISILGILIAVGVSIGRSSDIFVGAVSGATILLGVITAEWLRRFREQGQSAKRIVEELAVTLRRLSLNMRTCENPSNWENDFEFMVPVHNFLESASLLIVLAEWPLPRHVKVREQALYLRATLKTTLNLCLERNENLNVTEYEMLHERYQNLYWEVYGENYKAELAQLMTQIRKEILNRNDQSPSNPE
jgi:hypothetical protein